MDVLSSILNAMAVDPEYHRFVCYLKTTFLVAAAGDRYRVRWTTALMNGISYVYRNFLHPVCGPHSFNPIFKKN